MKKNKLDIFIPVGGLGRRLGGITKKTPKPLIKINNEPFLVKLIRSFNNLDYDNIYLLTNYKEKDFFFLKYQFRNLDLIKDKKRKGTFKSLFDCKKYIKNDFLYSNSDEILDLNIKYIIKIFKKKKIDILQLFFKDNLGKKLNKKFVINKKNFNKTHKYTEAGLKIFKKNIFIKSSKINFKRIEDYIEYNLKNLKIMYFIVEHKPYSIDTWKRLERTKKYLKKIKL